MAHLFDPLTIRGATLRNRIAVSPMCEYSSEDGFANNWHLVHLGSRAVGGAGLVMTEATGVTAEGRISPNDLGIYRDEHVSKLAEIAEFVHAHGAVAGIQLAHAGRKASMARPWDGGKAVRLDDGGWQPVAPSALAFSPSYLVPPPMNHAEIRKVTSDFIVATHRALRAGFRLVEIHAAHGYLFHEFLSPLSNERTDEYGGSFENRIRFLRRVVASVRASIPEAVPLLVRISATDWAPGGWELEQSCALVEALKETGVNLVDVSSGGMVPRPKVPVGPGYQTPFAAEIRRRTGVPTGAVGMITAPEQADHIVRTGQADLVFLAREMLRDPYWPRRAARALGVKIDGPLQYG